MERLKQPQEINTSREKRGVPRVLRTVLLLGTLAAALASAKADNGKVDASDHFTDPKTPNTISLKTPPNQQEYDRLINRAETSQAGTRVQGYIEVAPDVKPREQDRLAFQKILKGVQDWFYQNIGATFEIGGDVQFVYKPSEIQYPASLQEIFENSPVLPRVGVYVASSGLGEACDNEINNTTLLAVAEQDWRNQNNGTLVPVPAANLRFAKCLDNGLGAAYVGNDYLDSMPQDQAVIAIALDMAMASTLGDTNTPTLAKFIDKPQFAPEEINALRNSPLFSIQNPDWQPPQEPRHLLGDWNLLTITKYGCQPAEDAVRPITDQGIQVVVWGFSAGQWQAYNSEIPQASDLEELCYLQVIWIKPDHPVDW